MTTKIPTETEQVKPENDRADFYKKEYHLTLLQLERVKSANRDMANAMILNHGEIFALKNKIEGNTDYIKQLHREIQDLRIVVELERDDHADTKQDLKDMTADRDGWKNSFLNGKESNKQVHKGIWSQIKSFMGGK